MEKYPFAQKDSAEQSLLIDRYDPEMRAAKFVLDPQEYINWYHDYLESEHPNTSEHAVLAINEIYELERVILQSDFTELHPDLEQFIATDDEYDPATMLVLLTWLKEAGFTKEQVRTWVDIEQDDLSPAEQLQDRSIGVILNEVFGE